MRFEFELADPAHLDSLLEALRQLDSVYDAYRLVPGRGDAPAPAGRVTSFQSPKGTQDILPPRARAGSSSSAASPDRAQRFGFGLVVSPGFEDAEVFRRSSGDSSDVVTKEMYEFTDRGGRDDRPSPRGHGLGGARLRAAPPGAPVQGLVRGADVPLRASSGGSLPPAPPARGRDSRHRRPDGRRRGDLLAGRLVRRTSACRRCGFGSTRSATKTCAPGYREQLLGLP